MPRASRVEIVTRAQSELLTEQHRLTRAEQRGEMLLRAQPPSHLGSAGLPPAQLASVQPVAIRDLLALAPARSHDQRSRG